MKLAVFIPALFLSSSAVALDIEVNRTTVRVPSGTQLILTGPTSIDVDDFILGGEVVTAGHLLKIQADSVVVGESGRIRGYLDGDLPAQPPQVAPYLVAAKTGDVPPDQLGGGKYFGGTANAGSPGADGHTGYTGVAGGANPDPAILVFRKASIAGRIELRGQSGSKGGQGQDGQDGGIGAPGQNATCGKGNTTCYCYSGTMKSGQGNVGGLGGPGGQGGPGGPAIPLVMLGLEHFDSGIDPVSLAGAGGAGGDPGQIGRPGTNGGEGRSCSAEANWGDAFCSCSVGGGPRNPKVLADTRQSPDLGKGAQGLDGPNTDWNRTLASLSLPSTTPVKSPNVALFVDQSPRIASEIVASAIRLEVAGRLALTFKNVATLLSKAETSEAKNALFSEIAPQLQDITKVLERISASSKGLNNLIESSDAVSLDSTLLRALPLLRVSFEKEKSDILTKCSELSDSIKPYLGDLGQSYFTRTFSLCSPDSYNWMAFVLNRDVIRVGVRSSSVPPQFLPFLSNELQPIPQVEQTVSDAGLTIHASDGALAKKISTNSAFVSKIARGQFVAVSLALSAGDLNRSIIEQIASTKSELNAIAGGQ